MNLDIRSLYTHTYQYTLLKLHLLTDPEIFFYYHILGKQSNSICHLQIYRIIKKQIIALLLTLCKYLGEICEKK